MVHNDYVFTSGETVLQRYLQATSKAAYCRLNGLAKISFMRMSLDMCLNLAQDNLVAAAPLVYKLSYVIVKLLGAGFACGPNLVAYCMNASLFAPPFSRDLIGKLPPHFVRLPLKDVRHQGVRIKPVKQTVGFPMLNNWALRHFCLVRPTELLEFSVPPSPPAAPTTTQYAHGI
eukprot:gnl/TRDRNA2_/TRDRNA2_60033_c0_seq1.p1 gnl/TRDRNA2_/TRDRNA2_60033_c0~~gnl/TRDRNA2_/TRDRNA2_60033_c0_seq1.p1  ORF type:complete len:174 (+),score=8.29 gnl/TRDRNA2_/TRDRNA2_60033_c0_seq1:302-823(+)